MRYSTGASETLCAPPRFLTIHFNYYIRRIIDSIILFRLERQKYFSLLQYLFNSYNIDKANIASEVETTVSIIGVRL